MIVIIITIIQSFKQTCGEKKRTNKTIWILSTFLQAEERGANNQKQKMWGNPRKCAPGSHPNKPNVTQTGRMALLQRRLKGMSRCHSLGLLTSLFLLFLLLGRRFKEVVRVGGGSGSGRLWRANSTEFVSNGWKQRERKHKDKVRLTRPC